MTAPVIGDTPIVSLEVGDLVLEHLALRPDRDVFGIYQVTDGSSAITNNSTV